LARLLFFGYKCKDGMLLAEPEKAFLDFLYFTFKKQRSALAPEDIDFSRLNAGAYRRHLLAYRQRGLQVYARGLLERGRKAK